MASAPLGHARTHSPHPLQRAGSIKGTGRFTDCGFPKATFFIPTKKSLRFLRTAYHLSDSLYSTFVESYASSVVQHRFGSQPLPIQNPDLVPLYLDEPRIGQVVQRSVEHIQHGAKTGRHLCLRGPVLTG